jgi:hypothetical protein
LRLALERVPLALPPGKPGLLRRIFGKGAA